MEVTSLFPREKGTPTSYGECSAHLPVIRNMDRSPQWFTCASEIWPHLRIIRNTDLLTFWLSLLKKKKIQDPVLFNKNLGDVYLWNSSVEPPPNGVNGVYIRRIPSRVKMVLFNMQ